MKKKIAMLLCGVLSATMILAACGGNSGNNSGNDSSSTGDTKAADTTGTDTDDGDGDEGGSEASGAEANEDTVEINVMLWDRGDGLGGYTKEDNPMTDWLKEKVLEDINVKVNYVPVQRSTSDENLQMMMSGGTAPDIILTYEDTIYKSFAQDGGLADLTDALAQYGDNLNDILSEFIEVGQIGGVQYAIPARRSWQHSRHGASINAEWVEALGMELPTTVDELIEVLYAIQESDPGNLGSDLAVWAMGGKTDSERQYLNFINSYVTLTEEEEWLYERSGTVILHEQAIEGLRALNQLWLDGIIAQEFATDTEDDNYKQTVANGFAGFFLYEQSGMPDELNALAESGTDVNYAAIMPWANVETGEYIQAADPLYGAYIMVPKVSEDKVDACVKYLNWLGDAENAQNAYYTPAHKLDDGIPIHPSEEEKEELGYPKTTTDFSIVTWNFDYLSTHEGIVKSYTSAYTALDEEYFDGVVTTAQIGLHNDVIITDVLEAQSTYSANISQMIRDYVVNLIAAPEGQFDALQQQKFAEIEQAGWTQVLAERQEYYDTNVK